jgi:hypothetical protein
MRRAALEAQPLPRRTSFERSLGHNFSEVRIHAGPAAAAAAAAVKAQAFAHERDIFFGRGFYRLDTSAGRRLIAHELAHAAEPRPNVIARRAKIQSWLEWLGRSRGSRGGGPNHQAIAERLIAEGGTREAPVGNRNAADAMWRQGENGAPRDTYHQIGELNEVREDPINRERTNFEQMFDYFRPLGRDVDLWFWDRNNPEALEPIHKLRTNAPLDAQTDCIRAVRPKRGVE